MAASRIKTARVFQRASFLDRALMTCSALALLGMLVFAMWLTPDPRGFGTHEQLGLPPCLLRYYTGVPCPFCGMTTAFSLMAHGRVQESFVIQPAGAFAFLCAAILAPVLIALALAGRKIPAALDESVTRAVTGAGFVVVIGAWLYTLSMAVLHLR